MTLIDKGYFNCPQCRERQPCDLYQFVSKTYAYGFIPIAASEPFGPECYHCFICRHEFNANGVFGYDFGHHSERQTWKCFRCDGAIAYERFDCPHCGYVFRPDERR